MSEVKKGTYFLLPEETRNKIKIIGEEKRISQSESVAFMIDEYFKDRETEHRLLVDTLSKLFDEKLAAIIRDLKRIRVTGNVIDRDTKMMLEFWNHYFVLNDFAELATTEKYKTDELKEAEALVKKRIAENRQRRID